VIALIHCHLVILTVLQGTIVFTIIEAGTNYRFKRICVFIVIDDISSHFLFIMFSEFRRLLKSALFLTAFKFFMYERV